MTDPKTVLSPDQIAAQLPAGWSHDTDQITATFATGDFATGLALVNLIGASAEEDDHHPDILLTYPQVQVTLSSHDVGGVTSRDIRLATTINGHADSLALS